MGEKFTQPGCVIHCRVSSPKQSQYGESFETQEAIGRRIAESKGAIVLPNNRVWRESLSGRKHKRPAFEEILDYIKSNPGKVQYYIFSVIDRVTRGGPYQYEGMKRELAKCGVEMIDSRGIIQPSRNTLEGLGFKYDWSNSSPSEISELVEATRAKNEATDILTRTISQQIRLTQQGYHVGPPDDGYKNDKIYVDGKKKTIQIPDPERAKYYIRMFELRASGLHSDPEIVNMLNAEGFRTKIKIRWDKNHQKPIGRIGGVPITVKQLQRVIQKPTYSGVICEKWTFNKPIKAQYKGLSTIETFNRANQGKVFIQENTDGTLEILQNHNPNRTKKRNKNNPLFPNKFILCPFCRHSMTGSISKGKYHKGFFPGYHCSRGHKYFRVKKSEFENNVSVFFDNLKFVPDYLNSLKVSLINKYREKQGEISASSSDISRNIADLENEMSMKASAFAETKSVSIRATLEAQVDELEIKIKSARKERTRIEITEDDISAFIKGVKHLMEHPGKIILNQENPQAKESLLGLFFEKLPTYNDILNGTPKLTWIFELSKPNQSQESLTAAPQGVEPRFHA